MKKLYFLIKEYILFYTNKVINLTYMLIKIIKI